MRPVEPATHDRAHPRENRDTIPTLSSALQKRPPLRQGVGARRQAIGVDDTPVIASTISPQGRTVELTERKWAYIQRHVEMRGELELLLAAIRRPDLQEPDPRPGRERYWLRTQPPFRFRWLRVVVQFDNDVDSVVTAFGQDNTPEGLPR
jgi:hypothetical protein